MSTDKTPRYTKALQCGERIAHLRMQKRWSQRELARRSQFSYQQISKVEAGTLNTPIETLARIADALGVTLLDIVGEAKKDGCLELEIDWAHVEAIKQFFASYPPGKLEEMAGVIAKLEALRSPSTPPLLECDEEDQLESSYAMAY